MKKIFTLVAAALCSMQMMAKDYTCPLVVNMMGTDMPVGDIKVNVDLSLIHISEPTRPKR